MTLLLMEGWEGFSTGLIQQTYNTNSTVTVDSSGRTGGKRAVCNAAGAEYVEFPLAQYGSSSTTWIVGFAHNHISDVYATGNAILSFLDIDSNTMMTVQPSASTLLAKRGSTLLGITEFAYVTTVWYYLEFKITFDGSAGTVDIRVHNQSVLSLTSQNTTNTGNTLPYAIRIWSPSGRQLAYDDLYICDGVDATASQGSANNDFLGDHAIEVLRPDGNGTTNNYTGSDADSTDNYLHVDETDPDDDTTYVESGTSGNKDLYTVGDLATTPASITAVAVKNYARKTDGGALTFVNVLRSSTTESDSSAIAPSTDYQHHPAIYCQDPNTTAAWTEAGVNAIEIGSKVS